MATYIRVDRTGELIARAQQQMAENRFLQQERRELQAAQRQIIRRQALAAAGAFLQGGRRRSSGIEEIGAFNRPLVTVAPTFVTAIGSYAGQTLNISLAMETHKIKSRVRGNESISNKEIYRETASLSATGAALGFGYSYSALNCVFRGVGTSGAYYPSAVTPGTWLVEGVPTATPMEEPYLFSIAVQHNWFNVNVFDQTRQGGFVGIVTSESALLALSAQPGDFCLLLVDGPNYGYYIYDPFLWPSQPTNPINQSKKFGDWYYYFYTGVGNPFPVLAAPKNPFPSNLLASPFYGEVRWRLYVMVLYEVADNSASKLKYISPIPAVVACLATESRSQQINVVYPLDYVAGYKEAGIRNATSYNLANFGRPNNGIAWGMKRLENAARFAFGDSQIAEGLQPSNIYFTYSESIIIQNYEVVTWANTKFSPTTEPQPESQPTPRFGAYYATLRDPRRQPTP